MPTLRETILLTDDKKYSTVYVPEWKSDIRVRSLTAEEMERWFDILQDHDEKGVDPPGGRKASLVYMGTVDIDGSQLFRPEDIKVIGEKHPTAIHRIFEAIRIVTGLTEEVKVEVEKKPEDPKNSSFIGLPTDSESPT